MIAIDTNVLLRYLLADDQLQFKKSRELIEDQESVLITDVVLVEAIWTLTGKRYGFKKDVLCDVIRGLIGDSAFVFEDIQVIWSSLMDFDEAVQVQGKNLDFSYALIANKARFVSRQKNLQLSGFYSFDKAVAQLTGAKVPE